IISPQPCQQSGKRPVGNKEYAPNLGYPKVRPSMPTKATTVRKTEHLEEHQLLDGIMRGQPISD
ncbi:hypothetical protein, partial [Neisseria meningitidis]|uniref:hypothetical protein n=1 Tax=Neisseria meningitidis TaxID=487 RepID=UPI00053BC13C